MKRPIALAGALACLFAVASEVSASSTVEAPLLTGEAALEAGAWVEAEMAFRRAIGELGDSPAARIGLARALAGRGDTEGAVTGLLRAAERWLRETAYADAEEVLEAAARIAPDDPEVLSLLGRARVLDRRYLAAEPPLARAYGSGSADVETLIYYSSALWENGRLGRAEEVARAAVAASGDALPARYHLGRLLLWQSRFDEAIDLLRGCAEQAPEAIDIAADLARALDGAGARDEGLAAYRRAVALAPEHSELRYGYAMALLENGDRAAARAELENYRRLYEADQERTQSQGRNAARVARGRELLALGRPEEALELLRGLRPTADSLAALAAVLRSSGDLEAAAHELDRAVALAPGRNDLRALLNETRLELLRRP